MPDHMFEQWFEMASDAELDQYFADQQGIERMPELAKGTFYTLILHQDRQWKDINDNYLDIVNMSNKNLENVLNYLLSNASRFKRQELANLHGWVDGDISDTLHWSLNGSIKQLEETNSNEWMKETILFKAIQAELENRYRG